MESTSTDYTTVLNSINSTLSAIYEILETSMILDVLKLILYSVLILLFLYILRGE